MYYYVIYNFIVTLIYIILVIVYVYTDIIRVYKKKRFIRTYKTSFILNCRVVYAFFRDERVTTPAEDQK